MLHAKPIHTPEDAGLIESAVSLGLLPPNYSRREHPGLFESWAGYALDAINASRLRRDPLSDTKAIIDRAREMADRFCGQPLDRAKINPAILCDLPASVTILGSVARAVRK